MGPLISARRRLYLSHTCLTIIFVFLCNIKKLLSQYRFELVTKMKRFLFLALCSIFCASDIFGAKILAVLPTSSKSHWILAQPLLKELAKSGHEVTVISPFPVSNPPKNYRSIPTESMEKQMNEMLRKIFDEVDVNPMSKLKEMYANLNELANRTLHSPALVELMQSDEKFDLLFLEIFLNDAMLGFAHHYNCPIVAMSTVGASKWINDLTGSPNPLSYVPSFFLGFTDRMTFWQRLVNLLFSVIEEIFMQLYFYEEQNKIYDEYFPGPKPTLNELRGKGVSLALLNSHFSTSYPRPYLPNLVEVGGMHVNHESKPLPNDLKAFVEGAKEGVIYFSMGGNLKPSHMPKEKRYSILKALSDQKQKVILKWDDEESGKSLNPDKFFVGTWLPQDDILAHPNVKLFITHGGLLGSTEAIYHGIPLIGIPIFGDQKLNMARAELMGYGVKVDYNNLTETSLKWALQEILGGQKHELAAKKISKKFRDQPMKPLELAKFWVEYVLRNDGAEHLKSAALDLPFIQYHNLDIFLFLISIVVSLFCIVSWTCRKLCCSNKKSINISKKKKN